MKKNIIRLNITVVLLVIMSFLNLVLFTKLKPQVNQISQNTHMDYCIAIYGLMLHKEDPLVYKRDWNYLFKSFDCFYRLHPEIEKGEPLNP